MTETTYSLPKLAYGYKDLEPHMSEQQLTIHHTKHHQSYVNGANTVLERLDKARKDGTDVDMKSALKELSWNLSGHIMHSIFWETIGPHAGGRPAGALSAAIEKDFGSFDRFKKEFTQAAASVEGSGWAALIYNRKINRLLIMQVEKHNVNVIPQQKVLMTVDVFEHAYYVDYKNDRAKFIEAYWNLVNWDAAGKRFDEAR